MRLIGLILVALAVLCLLLPGVRDALPFRIALASRDAATVAAILGLAGVIALI